MKKLLSILLIAAIYITTVTVFVSAETTVNERIFTDPASPETGSDITVSRSPEDKYDKTSVLVVAKYEYRSDPHAFDDYIGGFFADIECMVSYTGPVAIAGYYDDALLRSIYKFVLAEPSEENVEKAVGILNKDPRVEEVIIQYYLMMSETVPGDVDGRDGVTVTDARLALRAAIGLEDIQKNSDYFIAADVNGDEAITVDDARLILRAAIGLETLPGER